MMGGVRVLGGGGSIGAIMAGQIVSKLDELNDNYGAGKIVEVEFESALGGWIKTKLQYGTGRRRFKLCRRFGDKSAIIVKCCRHERVIKNGERVNNG